jgi:hypothetical protein
MTAVFASPPEPGTDPKYPFAEWLNGQQWNLRRGRDFWGPPWALAKRIRGSANARGVKVELNYSDQGSTMDVRAVPRG